MNGNICRITGAGIVFSALISCANVPTTQPTVSRVYNAAHENGGISKSVYLDMPELGSISSVSSSSTDHRKTELIVTGTNSVIVYDKSNQMVVNSFSNLDHNALAHIGSSGRERVTFYSITTPIAVYDNGVSQVWADHPDGQFMDMAYGYTTNSDNPEFAVAYNKWRTSPASPSGNDVLPTTGMLRLFNTEGKVLWGRETPELWRLAFIDIDGDGKDEILTSDYDGKITARDGRGDIVRTYDQTMSRNYSLCNWPGSDSPKRILYSRDEKLWIRDLNGQLLATYDAPGASQYEAQAVPVRFIGNKEPYFAAIVKVSASKSEAYLYIYSPQGSLVHREFIPTKYVAIDLLKNDGNEALLVGGDGVVWQYSGASM